MDNDYDRVKALYRHGSRQLDQKDYAAAAITFSRAIHVQPSYGPGWAGQGIAQANLHRYAEALESFDRAIALEPDDSAVWTFRAVVLLHLERPAEALESCNRALNICSDYAKAWTFRGAALQRLGKYEQAYKSFAAATPEGLTQPSWAQKLQQCVKRRVAELRRFQRTASSS